MKSMVLFVIGMAGIAFAQDALHEAIDNGDYATAKAMVKNGEVQEIYCGKMPAKTAADVYAPFYKAAQQQFFESCPVQFSAAYANKVCADAKKMQLCAMSLDTLQVAALSGNPAALPAFEAAAKVAVKNKAYTKPVPVKVDTVLWKVCSKKESQDCLASCNAWADSALASAGDSSAKAAVENQKLLCSQKPQKRVNTTVTVNMPSSFIAHLDSVALAGYWTSPVAESPAWLKVLGSLHALKALPDSSLPTLPYVSLRARNYAAQNQPFPGGELFRFCEDFGEAVNAILDSAGIAARCPVFGSVTDPRDGQVYRTKDIADRTWMVQNMNFAVADSSECYDADPADCKSLGRLYTWGAARIACPEGMHLATDADWAALVDTAGGEAQAAMKLRANGSDDFAFSAAFGGYFNQNKIFAVMGEGAYFWTDAEEDASRAFARSTFSTDANVDKSSIDKRYGLSVRCVGN